MTTAGRARFGYSLSHADTDSLTLSATPSEKLPSAAAVWIKESRVGAHQRWEVGFFDGLGQGKIGILRVLDGLHENFEGMEFLGYSVLQKNMGMEVMMT